MARLLEAARASNTEQHPGVSYGAELRVLEVAPLKVDDIDSKRMPIRIEGGREREHPLVGGFGLKWSDGFILYLKRTSRSAGHSNVPDKTMLAGG